jgi:hypothetical protein
VRIERAKALVGRILDHTRQVLHLHASNHELNNTDQVGRQVPTSFAAHTFNLLRESQHRYELLRLAALWDAPSDDRESIPTLIEWVRAAAVRDELQRLYAAHWGNVAEGVEILGDTLTAEEQRSVREQIRASEEAFGHKEATGTRRQLDLAIRAADRLSVSKKVAGLVDFRNVAVAHNLGLAASTVTPQNAARYGDERFILDRTIHIVSGLNMGIRGAHFPWVEAKQTARRYAHAFWGGVKVQVLE